MFNVINTAKWDKGTEPQQAQLRSMWAAFTERDTTVDNFKLEADLVSLCEKLGVELPYDLR